MCDRNYCTMSYNDCEVCDLGRSSKGFDCHGNRIDRDNPPHFNDDRDTWQDESDFYYSR